MTQFELFCSIFYSVDAVWDNGEQNEDLRIFLSDCNPFIWAGEHSADPAMYVDFCKIINKENISVEESYDLASQYIEALPYYYAKGVREAFRAITKSEWLEGVNKYLSQPHKK